MAQDYSTNCYDVTHTVDMDMTQLEHNDEALRTHFSGASAPSNPTSYVDWADSANNLYKVYYGAAWYSVWDYANDRVAAGKVKTDSLASGLLSTDSTGRSKMADGYITNAKVADVDGSKITDNTISSGKIQNNAITPSKIYAGSSILCSNIYMASDVAIGYGASVPSYTSGMTIAEAYCYIPSGAKYITLSVAGWSGAGGTATVYVNVNGTTGSTCTLSQGSWTTTNGSALDISGQAGAFRYVRIVVVMNGATSANIGSWVVTWWGA